MQAFILNNLDRIDAVCRRLGVRRLELFGSAATDAFDPATSDVDFLFEFDDDRTALADRFFELQESLESILEHPVGLISAPDAKNPHSLRQADKHRRTLFAA